MREIKFRAWDKDSKKMFKIARFDFSDYTIYSHLFACDGYLREGCELMQSTGLKDKDGVEIYEGDIVKRTYLFNGAFGETHIGEVVYDKEYARYVISRPQKYTEPKTEDLGNVLSDKSTYEVIGNIWEEEIYWRWRNEEPNI